MWWLFEGFVGRDIVCDKTLLISIFRALLFKYDHSNIRLFYTGKEQDLRSIVYKNIMKMHVS